MWMGRIAAWNESVTLFILNTVLSPIRLRKHFQINKLQITELNLKRIFYAFSMTTDYFVFAKWKLRKTESIIRLRMLKPKLKLIIIRKIEFNNVLYIHV